MIKSFCIPGLSVGFFFACLVLWLRRFSGLGPDLEYPLGFNALTRDLVASSKCYDLPEEPHAEPGIFQSRCRLFGIMVESQVITSQKPNARQENSQTSKGRYLSIRKSTKGHRQKSNPNKGCRLQSSQLSGLQLISYRIML